MASDFRYSITLVDEKALKTTLNFVGTFSGIDANDEYALALAHRYRRAPILLMRQR
jgi:hypothetical protein